MSKKLLIVIIPLWSLVAFAQPRPYEIDKSFIPSLEFMQKSWTGEYDGLEPNSRKIISVKRALVLHTDMTYSNEVRGQIKNESEEILLKLETGTYQYDSKTQFVTYTIEMDSTLDINNYLQEKKVSYAINRYKQNGIEKTSNEIAQFTRGANDAARQWVLFDQQLMSPIDQRQKAVYIMIGKELGPSSVLYIVQNEDGNEVYYDLRGFRTNKPNRGIYIVKGKKVVIGTNRGF